MFESSSVPFSSIEEALQRIKRGEMVVVVDDEHRENEGDLTLAAESVTPEAINFMPTTHILILFYQTQVILQALFKELKISLANFIFTLKNLKKVKHKMNGSTAQIKWMVLGGQFGFHGLQ